MKNAGNNKFSFIDDFDSLNENKSDYTKSSAEKDVNFNRNIEKKDADSNDIGGNTYKNNYHKTSYKKDTKKKNNYSNFNRDYNKYGDKKDFKNKKNYTYNSKLNNKFNSDKNPYVKEEKDSIEELDINYEVIIDEEKDIIENDIEMSNNDNVSVVENKEENVTVDKKDDEDSNTENILDDEENNIDSKLDEEENNIDNKVDVEKSNIEGKTVEEEKQDDDSSNNVVNIDEDEDFLDRGDKPTVENEEKKDEKKTTNDDYKKRSLKDSSDNKEHELVDDNDDVVEEAEFDKFDEIDSFTFSSDGSVDENVVVDNSEIDKSVWAQSAPTKHKFHFSFQYRIGCLIAGILILFVSACFMIYNALKINSEYSTTYKETSNVDFNVVLDDGSKYGSGLKYGSSFLEEVNINFTAEAEFNDDINYDLRYRVVLYNRIYDRGQVIFEDEDIVVKKDTPEKVGNTYKYSTSVRLDYQKYNRFVKNYSRYSPDNDSDIDVILYVDTPDGSRKLSSISIPLDEKVFEVELNNPRDASFDVLVSKNEWSNTNTLIVVVGSVLILLSLLLLTRLTRLITSTLERKNKYESTLVRLFSEYDKFLVVARGGYESDIVKNVVKVDSFKELLNVREILNKPIIFSKINNVKSEFIIDDDDLIYKYILKEADIEK